MAADAPSLLPITQFGMILCACFPICPRSPCGAPFREHSCSFRATSQLQAGRTLRYRAASRAWVAAPAPLAPCLLWQKSKIASVPTETSQSLGLRRQPLDCKLLNDGYYPLELFKATQHPSTKGKGYQHHSDRIPHTGCVWRRQRL